jgi:hypothetical protein
MACNVRGLCALCALCVVRVKPDAGLFCNVMKIKLSPWSIALLLIAIVLALNVFHVITVDAWGIFGIVVSVACAWAIYWIFLRKRD